MVQVDVDQPLTQQDILAEFRQNVAAAVQPFSELSFKAFDYIGGTAVKLSRWQAEHVVRRGLLEIAENLPEPALRAKFMTPGLTDKELVNVLEYADEQALLSYSKEIIRISAHNPELAGFLQDKFDNILYFAGTSEKEELLKFVLQIPGSQRTPLAAAILRSSESLEELEALTGSHENVLKANNELREFCAQAVFSRFARELELPSPISREASPEQCEAYRRDLEACLRSLADYCAEHPYGNTRTALDLSATVMADLADIRLECALYAYEPDAVIDRLNINRAILELELKHCVNIGYGTGQMRSFLDFFFPDAGLRWSEQDVKDLAAVLERIPEKHLIFSPFLREIQRVPYLGDSILGARYRADGVIKLAELTFNHEKMQGAFDGMSSLSIVLAHELGHGLQIGKGPAGVEYPQNGGPVFGKGESQYDFDEYAALSGWRVIEHDRYEVLPLFATVDIDGKEYPLELPVEFEGKRVIFTYDMDDGDLLMYSADAKFSYRDYARSNPWEDFAEAFAEYIFLPERLIALSPQKFQHLENELRRYHGDARIQALLENALLAPAQLAQAEPQVK